MRILTAALFFIFTYSAVCAERPHKHHHLGYIPDDAGVHKVNVINNRKVALAKVGRSVDLTALMPPVYDQGPEGSCTGNGAAAIYDFDNFKVNGSFMTPSRQFIYYGARVIEGDPGEDNGAQIHDVIAVLQKSGTPSEKTWPYNVDQYALQPSPAAFREAQDHQALHVYSVDNGNGGLQIKQALSAGFPVVFGCTVYPEIQDLTSNDYKLPMPGGDEKPDGGHCMVVVGYTPDGWYIIRNSWSEDWGNKGYLLMSAAYIEGGLSDDFWVVDSVEPNAPPSPNPVPPAPPAPVHSWIWHILHPGQN